MDPYSLFKVLWRHRKLAIPVLVLTLLAAGFVVLLGPRTYESTAVYVIANPNVPTDQEVERDPRLARLNGDNPYLRAADSSLIVKAVVSKMSSQTVQQAMKDKGLSTDYTVAQSAASTMTVMISAFGSTPALADSTRKALIDSMGRVLYDLQKVNGADDRFVFTALPIDSSDQAVEKVSSRLRTLILVLAAGAILVMGVVSIGVASDRRKGIVTPSDSQIGYATDFAEGRVGALYPAPVLALPPQEPVPARLPPPEPTSPPSAAVAQLNGATRKNRSAKEKPAVNWEW